MNHRIFFLGTLLLLLLVTSTLAQDIFTAIQQNDSAAVVELVEADPSVVNARDIAGRQPIHFAAHMANLPLVDYLIEEGADPTAITTAGTTTMHYAAFSGSVPVINRLLELGLPADAASMTGATPLTYAVMRGHADATKRLLEAGADINAASATGKTIFHNAVESGNLDLVKLLLDRGAALGTKDKDGGDALEFALATGSDEIVQFLLEQNAFNPDHHNITGRSYVHAAVEGKLSRRIETLIERGARINEKDVYGMTPLDYAVAFEDTTSIVTLKAHKAKSGSKPDKIPKGRYLGQRKPGKQASLFAPRIISTPYANERDIQFTSDGRELYFTRWTRGSWDVQVTRVDKKRWSEPAAAGFCTPFTEAEAYLTRDEQTMFFISNRPDSGSAPAPAWDLFYITREPDGWSQAKRIGDPFTGGYFTSFTNDGTMYLTLDEMQQRARKVEGGYADPEPLPEEINFVPGTYNSFVAADESYLIFTAHHESSIGDGDLYICFRREDDTWTKALNMGPEVNSTSRDYCPWVSWDGKAFFFTSSRYGNEDIFWMDAGLIERLRAQAEE